MWGSEGRRDVPGVDISEAGHGGGRGLRSRLLQGRGMIRWRHREPRRGGHPSVLAPVLLPPVLASRLLISGVIAPPVLLSLQPCAPEVDCNIIQTSFVYGE